MADLAAEPTDLQAETTEVLQRLIRFNTVNPPGNERAAIEYLEAYVREAGFETELLAADSGAPEPDRDARRRDPTARRWSTWATSTRCSRTPRTGSTIPGRVRSPTAISGAAARST